MEVKITSKYHIIKNSDGVALITVLLMIVILSIIAAVAIGTSGSDIISAGKNSITVYTFNTANSGMNIVLSQIGTDQGTNDGIGMPTSGLFYYTVDNNNTVQTGNNFIELNTSNINPSVSNILTDFSGQIGFEYSGTYGPIPGYSSNYYFYKGQINVIAQKGSNTAKSGMTFDYGPNKLGY